MKCYSPVLADLQHQMWVLTFDGRLHTTPLSPRIDSVLDVGTGTGTWAETIAHAFPTAKVIATDLILPPRKDGTPPNLHYTQHNADDLEWTLFRDSQFDFIHTRMMTSGIRDWPAFRANCFRHLKPGGNLEIIDVSHPLRSADERYDCKENSALINFVHVAGKSWRNDGFDYHIAKKQIAGLREVGFEDVEETVYRWPIGSWSEEEREKKLGRLSLSNTEKFLTLRGPHILTNKGFMSKGAADKVLDAAKDDFFKTNERKYYYVMKVHTARKPAQP
ncbi:S-adenosyl-L-methionine-dependent methyltransferase [Bimuria novae-zelandiae CBS 107.79]|uniref:S-adenosyl-L-methionine-dependent methyltransferase n=1 Tax=Bimuria novae-zelandiae CBS 107.79 TaxID=1447943 RepID=A0A6A5V0K6_9PLEO|nr:S-adenosyl-L-methionine-dependent methyltransferase [Bimuria novae-zelandiae CBS 107.79]